jgi:ferredoxin-NADP reductase
MKSLRNKKKKSKKQKSPNGSNSAATSSMSSFPTRDIGQHDTDTRKDHAVECPYSHSKTGTGLSSSSLSNASSSISSFPTMDIGQHTSNPHSVKEIEFHPQQHTSGDRKESLCPFSGSVNGDLQHLKTSQQHKENDSKNLDSDDSMLKVQANMNRRSLNAISSFEVGKLDTRNMIGRRMSLPTPTTLRKIVERENFQKSFVSGKCPVFQGAASVNADLLEKNLAKIDTENEFRKGIEERELFGNSSVDGYFSREYGFLCPDYNHALTSLMNSKGRIWYDMGLRIQGLLKQNKILEAIDKMEVLDGSKETCPDECLQIAASILVHLVIAYRAACQRNFIEFTETPPLYIPLTQICRRLGRRGVYMSAEDLMYNQRPSQGKDFTIDNCEMVTPIYGTNAEIMMSKLFCESNIYVKDMLNAILALCRGEWKVEYISCIIHTIKDFTRALGNAVPDSNRKKGIDPVEFNVAFANAVAPLKSDVPALSGAGCPIFFLIDSMIGRQMWESIMGKDLQLTKHYMPKNWRRFLEYVRQKKLFEHVPSEFEYLWVLLKDSYCGDRGWLGKHKYRAYQFIELAKKLGRSSNKGSATGEEVIDMLENSRLERDLTFTSDRGSYEMCHFQGRISKVKRVSEDRDLKMITIESKKKIFLNIGDHIAVLMKNSDDKVWRFSTKHHLNLNSSLSLHDGTLTSSWKVRLDFESLDYTVYNLLMCAKLYGTYQKVDITNLCHKMLPEEPRLYSFASLHPEDKAIHSFDLLVRNTGPGGCSAFLHESEGKDVSFGISTGANLVIPRIKTRPLVVIAAGSGIGTYLPMLFNDGIVNPKIAFLAFRTEHTVPLLNDHFKHAVNYGKLDLFVELSRENISLRSHKRMLLRSETGVRYIDALMMEEADLLEDLALSIEDGGREATFYICGNSEFFTTVRATLDKIDPSMVPSLVRDGRLNLEVQARGEIEGKGVEKVVHLRELCTHNRMNDYWTVIDGKCYDFTDYIAWHPGGSNMLQLVAGTDCSSFWKIVGHSRDRMVYSQIHAYQIGIFDDSNDDGLMEYLEFVTRCENYFTLYQQKDDLFKTICDSYGRIQRLIETVLGREFYKIVLLFVKDIEIRSRILTRLYVCLYGRMRAISNCLYSVSEMPKGNRHRHLQQMPGAMSEALRRVTIEEKKCLAKRMRDCSEDFFAHCKDAIIFASDSIFNKTLDLESVHNRLCFRLVTALEQFYVGMAKPLPTLDIKGWKVIQNEILERKTFVLRFKSFKGKQIPKEFQDTINADVWGDVDDDFYLLDELEKHLSKDRTSIKRDVKVHYDDTIMAGWLNNDASLRKIFDALDKDSDGFITRDDFENVPNSNVVDPKELDSIKEEFDRRGNDYKTMNFCDYIIARSSSELRLNNICSFLRRKSLQQIEEIF